jgi:hypothetical protein
MKHDKKYDTSKTIKRRRFRRSTVSECSYGCSSVTSNTGYHNFVVVPPHHTPTSLNLRPVGSPSFSGCCRTPLNVHLESLHDQFGYQNGGDSPVELQRSSSPRINMNIFRAENDFLPATKHTGPMERFLAQDDTVTDFGEDPARVEEEWRKLRSLRTNALRLRSYTKSKRQELQEKQVAKSAADAEFMQYVRKLRFDPQLSLQSPEFGGHLDGNLESYYKAMQDARDTYGPAEYEYNELEEQLDETEFELAKTEGRVYKAKVHSIDDTSGLESSPDLGIGSPRPAPVSLLGLSSDASDEYHPLQVDYLSRLGDLDLAKERRQNLVLERERLLMARESKVRVGMELHEHEKEFLANFPAREANLLGEITEIEEDVERMKATCIEAGLEIIEEVSGSLEGSVNDDDPTVPAKEGVTPHETSLDRDLIPESSQSLFPLLLPKSDPAKASLESLITNFDESNKGDRVKRWMLYKLRTSPLEVELLVRIFLQVLDVLNFSTWQMGITDWQFCVLFYWDEDETNKSPGAYKGLQTPSSNGQSYPSVASPSRGRPHSKLLGAPTITTPKISIHRRSESAPGLLEFARFLEGRQILRMLGL